MQVARGGGGGGGGGVHPGASLPGTILRSGPLRMYFEFLNRTQTLNFGYFGGGGGGRRREVGVDFERKVGGEFT